MTTATNMLDMLAKAVERILASEGVMKPVIFATPSSDRGGEVGIVLGTLLRLDLIDLEALQSKPSTTVFNLLTERIANATIAALPRRFRDELAGIRASELQVVDRFISTVGQRCGRRGGEEFEHAMVEELRVMRERVARGEPSPWAPVEEESNGKE